MGVYHNNGYIDFNFITRHGMPFVFVWGGRGTGKTFGSILHVDKHFDDTGRQFLFLRRTQVQSDLIAQPQFSPFSAITEETGREFAFTSEAKNIGGIRDPLKDNQLMGVFGAASTFGNMRGFDGSRTDTIIFDEFIPKETERPFKGERTALPEVYETVNRNRELKGKRPVQAICLSNSNELANPVFSTYGIIDIARKMAEGNIIEKIIPQRGIALYNLGDSDISAQKKNTALYRALGDNSEYSEMALGNRFVADNTSGIRSQPFREYRPVYTINGVTVYRHKSGNTWYVSATKSGSPDEYTMDDIGRKAWVRKYGIATMNKCMAGLVYFESYDVKTRLTSLLF